MLSDFQYNILLSCCYFTVFVILHHVWLKNYRSFVFHRYALLLMPVIAAILPWVSFSNIETISTTTKTLNLKPILVNSNPTPNVNTAIEGSLSIYEVTLLILCVGTVISLFILIKNYIKILKSIPKEFTNINGYKVYHSNKDNEAWTFGKSIVIPSNFNETEQEIVFSHEKTHAQQLHTLDVIYSELIKSILWWNPAVYIWKNDIKSNHEFIADNEVIKYYDKEIYGLFLLNTTLKTNQLTLTNTFFNPSILKRRIKMMKTQSKFIKIVPVIALAGITITMTAFSTIQEKTFKEHNKKISVAEDSVLNEVDVQPSFPGGNDAMFKYLGTNIKYPEKLKEKGIEEKLFIEFVVDKSGKIRDIKKLKGENKAFIDESIRVVKAMPDWIPGEKDGKKVNVRMVLPFMYKLTDDK